MTASELEVPPTEADLRTALSVLGALGEPAILVASDRIEDATPACCRLLGYSRDELRGLPSAILLAPEPDRAVHRERLASSQRGEPSAAHLEVRATTRSGATLTLDVTVTNPDDPQAKHRIVLLKPAQPERPVSRVVVHEILARVGAGIAREATLRAMGRHYARHVHHLALEEALAKYRRDGLGDLRLAATAGDSFTFEGRELIEEDEKRGACFLALGFIESLVAAIARGESLGTEVQCRARGAPACVFVVRARPRPHPPA